MAVCVLAWKPSRCAETVRTARRDFLCWGKEVMTVHAAADRGRVSQLSLLSGELNVALGATPWAHSDGPCRRTGANPRAQSGKLVLSHPSKRTCTCFRILSDNIEYRTVHMRRAKDLIRRCSDGTESSAHIREVCATWILFKSPTWACSGRRCAVSDHGGPSREVVALRPVYGTLP